MKRIASILTVTAAAVLTAACAENGPVAPAPGLTSIVPSGSVQAAIQQEPLTADGKLTFIVRVMTKDVVVSSFQGAVTFEPGAFELVSVQSPESHEGAAYFLNAGEFARGSVKFSAFTPLAYTDAATGDGVEAFRFTVKPLRMLDAAHLVATLTAVGQETGVRMSADRIYASPGVHDLAGNLIVK